MASPELTKEIDPTESSNAATGPINLNSDAGDSNAASLPDFVRAVDDAMCLLFYAAESGKNVDDATRNSILHARASRGVGLDETASDNLLAALTKVAAELSPVFADSIRASSKLAEHTT